MHCTGGSRSLRSRALRLLSKSGILSRSLSLSLSLVLFSLSLSFSLLSRCRRSVSLFFFFFFFFFFLLSLLFFSGSFRGFIITEINFLRRISLEERPLRRSLGRKLEQVSWAFLLIPLIWSKKGTDLESILIAVFFTSSYVSRSSLVVSQLHLITTRLDCRRCNSERCKI